MVKRLFNPLIARFAAVAALLILALVAPAVFAEEHDEPCSLDSSGDVTCSYEENGPDAVATFTSSDPEGLGIAWDVIGPDAPDFTIEGGVLTFNKSPDFETPSDRDEDDETVGDQGVGDSNYKITVISTEVRAEGDASMAQSNMLDVTVKVTNVDEDGTVDLSRLQSRVGAAGLTASLSDLDGNVSAPSWQWSIPKVARPELENDEHWKDAGAVQDTLASYTPVDGDAGEYLRVKVIYTDGEGAGKDEYALSDYPVLAALAAGITNDAPVFPGDGDYGRTLPEDTAVGANVGAPVTANPVDSDRLTYVLSGTHEASFAIDKATGQITVAAGLDFEDGGDGDGEYTVTVTAYDPSNASVGQSVTITTTDVNEAPSVTGSAAVSNHFENDSVDDTYTALAETYTPSDLDAGDDVDDLTLSLSGADEAVFELGAITNAATGARVLNFKTAPNYEAPADADGNNIYKVTVVATDDDGITGEQAVTVSVTNVNEGGSLSLSSMQPQSGVALTATLSDPDGGETEIVWKWESSPTGAANSFVEIEGATSASYTPVSSVDDDPDTEANEAVDGDEGKFLQVTVTYNDAQEPDDPDTEGDEGVDRTLTAEPDNAVREAPDTNNAPVFTATITREVDEGTPTGGNVGDPVEATDADDDELTYTLSGGADMASFDIDPGTGQITVGAGTELNFEGDQTTYMVEVTAADAFGESGTVMVTIMVADEDEPPTFEGDNEIDDYAEKGTGPVATFTATDPEGAGIGWTLEGPDAADFSIDDNGVLTFKESPDYESATDREHDADNSGSISGGEGAGDNKYEIEVHATEARAEGDAGVAQSATLDVTVTVTNVDEEGSISLTLLQPQTGVELTASLSDPDGGVSTITWQWSVPKVARPELEEDDHWTPGAATTTRADAYTAAVGDEGDVLRVKASYTDDEGAGKTEYKLSYHAVRAAPSANDAPGFSVTGVYTRSIPEDAAVGTVVGAPVTATDLNADDVGKLTYDLSGADAGSFNIDKMTGQITVAAELDHERSGGETYAVAVGVSDPSVNDETTPFDTAVVVRQAVIITVTDVNEAPSVTGSAAVSNHFENDSVDDTYTALAETYTPSDLDAGDDVDDLTLSLSGADEAVFELGAITNAATGARVLNFKTAPNYEAPADADGNNIYKVTVVATDDDGITGEQAVTVSVTNVNEGGSLSLSSMQPQSGVALTATLSDPDGGETEIVWKWESSPTGAANSFVEIEGATSASYTPVSSVDDDPDTEANEAVDGDEGKFLQVTVTYNDDQKPDDPDTEGDEGVDRTLTAEPDNAVREAPDTNNAPVFTATITREVDEGTPTGGNVGDPVEATDADDDELTYTLSGGADMASFDIDPGTGQITVGAGTELNFEGDQTTYMVEVTAADAFGESGTVMVTIMVADVDEPPTTPTLGGGTPTPTPDPNNAPEFADDAATRSVDENTAAGMAVGAPVTATDADTDDTLTYTLGGADMASFNIDGATGQIMTSAALDYESQSSYTVMVTASDGEDSDSTTVTIMVANVGLDNAYDADDSGAIDKEEVLAGVDDYFDNVIDKGEVLALIDLYFG